ncbi:Gfo/Idh/MocA family protein [Ruminococcus sp. 5_1_39BFAA]|uniref:Gfo/Idh/MocA family protein n=1 Tax=Ruminococcus sp. 5_1_39BFAA TaxID=457412 RepID=UPI00356461B0
MEENKKKKIRIGLLGCGRVAGNHILAVNRCSSVEITAVAGGRHAKELGERLGVPVLQGGELCGSGLVDGVCILTPPQYHYDYAMEAIQAGKHVLVEKPVSFSVNEILEMDSAAEKKGVVCMPGHSYLYLPELMRMKEVQKDGRLGSPGYLYMSETYYMNHELSAKYTGPETDVLCHQLYLSLAFLGIPKRISAFRTEIQEQEGQMGGPQVAVMLEYENGAIVQILVCWAMEDHTSDPWTFKIKMLGTKGSMHFSRRDFVENLGMGYDQSLYQEMFDREMRWFAEECIGKGNQPLSTMKDAAWVCRLHGMILEAVKEKKIVEVHKD